MAVFYYNICICIDDRRRFSHAEYIKKKSHKVSAHTLDLGIGSRDATVRV